MFHLNSNSDNSNNKTSVSANNTNEVKTNANKAIWQDPRLVNFTCQNKIDIDDFCSVEMEKNIITKQQKNITHLKKI